MQLATHSFWIDCNPPRGTAQASVRILKRRDGSQFVGRSMDSKATAVRQFLAAHFNLNRPPSRFEGPVRLRIEWVSPWRSAEPKRERAKGEKLCDRRPDCDNLCKLVLDVLTQAGFWVDDAQVADLRLVKKWGDRPGIGIRIEGAGGNGQLAAPVPAHQTLPGFDVESEA